MSDIGGAAPVPPIEAYKQQLKQLDLQLGTLKTKVESNTNINIKEVRSLINTMESCATSKPFGSQVIQTTETKVIDHILNSLGFFMTSKAAQEQVGPLVVLFKNASNTLKKSLIKSRETKKKPKVEKIAKGEQGHTRSRF